MRKCLLITIFFCTIVGANVEAKDFRFIVVGDRAGGPVDNVFEEIIDEVKLLKPDLVMGVGDLINGYTEDTMAIYAQWDTVLSIVKKLDCPFYFVAGNHDIQNELDRKIFKARTGFNRYYSFDYKNNHFIVLDNTMTYWTQPEEMDAEQINWLKKDLEKKKNAENIFVFYHIPTYLYALRDNTVDSLVGIFEKYGVDMVFTGHHHEYSYINLNNIEYVNVGSSGGVMETNDFARGHFYHYVFVTVAKKEKNIAVIRKGNVFPCNIVTAEDLQLIARADRETVNLPSCLIKEGSKNTVQTIKATIDNWGPDSIFQNSRWFFDSTRYNIEPENLPLAIGSEEKGEYKFNLTSFNGSDIYPLPYFVLAYPFTYGKLCTLKNSPVIKRFKYVKRITTSPVIDGNLIDETWKTIEPITNLGSYDGLATAPTERTEIYLGHDKENLYMGVRCFESDFSKLQAAAKEHDGTTYIDDNIWFFLDSDFDQETYYQMIINPQGIIFDRLCSLKDGKSTKDLAWNGHWEVKSGREANAWTLEIKIPKNGLAPYNENQWGFNFRRLQNRIGDAGYWSLPFGHDPTNFGVIGFE